MVESAILFFVVILIFDLTIAPGILNIFVASLMAFAFVDAMVKQNLAEAVFCTVMGLANCYLFFRSRNENPPP